MCPNVWTPLIKNTLWYEGHRSLWVLYKKRKKQNQICCFKQTKLGGKRKSVRIVPVFSQPVTNHFFTVKSNRCAQFTTAAAATLLSLRHIKTKAGAWALVHQQWNQPIAKQALFLESKKLKLILIWNLFFFQPSAMLKPSSCASRTSCEIGSSESWHPPPGTT